MFVNLFDIKNIEDYILLGKKVALLSFLIGTLIIGIYFLSHYNGIIYISMFFIMVAFIANTILGFYLIYQFIKQPDYRKSIAVTLFLMIINIPVGFYYLDLGFKLYNKFLNS